MQIGHSHTTPNTVRKKRGNKYRFHNINVQCIMYIENKIEVVILVVRAACGHWPNQMFYLLLIEIYQACVASLKYKNLSCFVHS